MYKHKESIAKQSASKKDIDLFYDHKSMNPDARQNQLISLAEQEAEKRIRNGTASSQIIVHYLELGTSKYKREVQILEHQDELLQAKTDTLRTAKDTKKLYEDAMNVMKKYSGNSDDELDSDDISEVNKNIGEF